MYELKRKEGRARRGTFSTVHGTEVKVSGSAL